MTHKLAPKTVEDFGPANYIESRLMDKYLLLCQSSTNPEAYYLYQRQATKRLADGTSTMYYRCIRCIKISYNNPGSVIVRNERLMRDPSLGHYDNCCPYTGMEIESLKAKREMRRRVLNDGLRPLDAYKEALDELRNRTATAQEFEKMRQQIGEYEQNRSALYRCAREYCDAAGIAYRKRFSKGKSSTPKRSGGQVRSAGSTDQQMQVGEREAHRQSSNRLSTGQLSRNFPSNDGTDEGPFAVEHLEELIAQPDTTTEAGRQITSVSAAQQPRVRPPQPLNAAGSRPVIRSGVANAPQIMLNGALRPVPVVSEAPGTLSTEQSIANVPASRMGSAMIPARSVFSALTRALAVCKKKSRWESFGDYVGKTLESLPETSARRVSREIQRLIDSEQDALVFGNHHEPS